MVRELLCLCLFSRFGLQALGFQVLSPYVCSCIHTCVHVQVGGGFLRPDCHQLLVLAVKLVAAEFLFRVLIYNYCSRQRIVQFKISRWFLAEMLLRVSYQVTVYFPTSLDLRHSFVMFFHLPWLRIRCILFTLQTDGVSAGGREWVSDAVE